MSALEQSRPGIDGPTDPAAPEIPSALRARVAAALARHGDAGSPEAAHAPAERARRCLSAGEALLADVLAQEGSDRAAALDLLAADALVTYAFELLASEPDDLERAAASALRRIAAQGVRTVDA